MPLFRLLWIGIAALVCCAAANAEAPRRCPGPARAALLHCASRQSRAPGPESL